MHQSSLLAQQILDSEGQSSGAQFSSTTAQISGNPTGDAFSQVTDASSHIGNTPSQVTGISTEAQGVPGQNPQQQPQNPGTHISRPHKTHLLHNVDKLKFLPFKLKLSMNKHIEQQNEQRALRAYNHVLDPVNNSDPGSEAASLITISSEEILSLRILSVMSTLSSVMPLYLLRLTGLKDHNKDKRRHDISHYSPDSDAHVIKR